MVKFRVVRNIITVIIAIGTVLVAVAYGTPYLRAGDCRDLAIEYLEQHPVQGREFDRKWVRAKPSDVRVYVTGMFSSQAGYFVPNDMHAIRYSHECKSNPFSTSMGPRERSFTL